MLVTIQPLFRPPVAVIRVGGEVDVASGPRLLEVLRQSLDQECTQICVDLGDVTFMDSAGVTVIERAHQEAQRRDANFEVVRRSDSVRRIAALIPSTVLSVS